MLFSPSGHASWWKPVGAIPTGKLISVPRSLVLVSITDTSRSIRGRKWILQGNSNKTPFRIVVAPWLFAFEAAWKLGLHLPIAMQESKPIKKTTYKETLHHSFFYFFAFRGPFSQQFGHFHLSLILYTCSLATILNFYTSHFSLPYLISPVLLLSIPQFTSTCSPVPGLCLPLYHSCLSSLYIVPALTVCSTFPKSHTTYV